MLRGESKNAMQNFACVVASVALMGCLVPKQAPAQTQGMARPAATGTATPRPAAGATPKAPGGAQPNRQGAPTTSSKNKATQGAARTGTDAAKSPPAPPVAHTKPLPADDNLLSKNALTLVVPDLTDMAVSVRALLANAEPAAVSVICNQVFRPYVRIKLHGAEIAGEANMRRLLQESDTREFVLQAYLLSAELQSSACASNTEAETILRLVEEVLKPHLDINVDHVGERAALSTFIARIRRNGEPVLVKRD